MEKVVAKPSLTSMWDTKIFSSFRSRSQTPPEAGMRRAPRSSSRSSAAFECTPILVGAKHDNRAHTISNRANARTLNTRILEINK